MATFGNTTAGGDTFPCSSDRAQVSLFTLSDSADVTQINCRFDASSLAGTSFKGLIYADSAGSPGARLAVGAATAVPAGGGVIASSVTVSLSPGDYWLGYVCNGSDCVYEIEVTGTSQRQEALTYASPANPFGTPAGSSTEICVYATYTVAGGTAKRLLTLGVG